MSVSKIQQACCENAKEYYISCATKFHVDKVWLKIQSNSFVHKDYRVWDQSSPFFPNSSGSFTVWVNFAVSPW